MPYYVNSILLIPFSVLTQDGEPHMYGLNVTSHF